MQKFIISVTEENLSLIKDPALECFILNEKLSAEFIDRFAAQAKEQSKLVLGQNKEMCLKHNLDGVVLDLSKSEDIAKDYGKETQNLKGRIIGAICRGRRHEAMITSECEPDFVIFRAWADGAQKIIDLTNWYNEFFLIQSALLLEDDNLDFLPFKTDFVILNDIKYKNSVAKS